MKENKIKSNKYIQNKFKDILSRYRIQISNLTLNHKEKDQSQLIDAELEKCCSKDWTSYFNQIINFDKVITINGLNKNLSFGDLTVKIGSLFGEIDCVSHLMREFKDKMIEKLIENNFSSSCDFMVHDKYPLFVETKSIKKFTDGRILLRAKKSLGQIDHFIKIYKNSRGAIWIFTYNNNIQNKDILLEDYKKIDNTVNKIKNELMDQVSFDFTLTVQIYKEGLFGDSAF